MRRWVNGAAVIGGAAALAAFVLVVVATAPSSRDYQPASPAEKAEMDRSTYSVHPDDVRADIDHHRVQVAWTGVLRDVQFSGAPEKPTVSALVDHHYFDWIDDRSARSERFLPSPRGEGQFRFTRPLSPAWDIAAMKEAAPPGSMVVVYGTPSKIEGAVVDLGEAAYARVIPIGRFSTGVLDYGRRTAKEATSQ